VIKADKNQTKPIPAACPQRIRSWDRFRR